MIKLIMMIILSNIIYGTSSMSDITKIGYFDIDKIEDKIICDQNTCIIKTSLAKDITLDISNNMDCRDLIIKGTESRGEILIECGGYFEVTQKYYKYNKNLNNWFLNVVIYEKVPSSPSSTDYEYSEKSSNESWSIDNNIYYIKGKSTLLSINENIATLYKNKSFLKIKALIKSIDIEDIKINKKNLTTYNNIAYYLQKAGANKEAIYQLEKILEKYPNRTVAHYNLADAYWALGEKKKAIKAYTTYIEQMKEK